MLGTWARAGALALVACLPALAAPDPADAGKPAPPHRLIWTSKTADWNRAVAVAPWGGVVSCSMWRLRLHAHDTGQVLATLDLPGAAIQGGLGFAGEGLLVVVTEQGIHTLTLPTLGFTKVAAFTQPIETVRVVGSLVAVAQKDGAVRVHRVPAAEPIHTLQVPGAQALALTEDGALLAVGCKKGLVVLHDLSDGTSRPLIPAGRSGNVGALAFSPGGRLLLADRPGFQAELRSVETGGILTTFRKGSWLTEARFLDARRVAVAGSNGLELHAKGVATVTPSYGARRPSTVGLAVGAEGRLLAVGDRKGTVALFGFGPRWVPPAPPFELSQLKVVPPKDDPDAPFPRQSDAERLAGLSSARSRRTEAPKLSSLPTEVRSFLKGPSGAERAFFVRVTEATIGGEFDAAGNEEVQVDLDVGGSSRKLIREILDLPSGRLEEFSFDAPWVELAPAATFSLGVRVRDEDLTEWEEISSTQRDLVLEPSGFPDAPRAHDLELETIRLTEYFFLVPKKVLLRGASVQLETVGAPRRDEPDASFRETISRLFGPVLKTPLPNTPPSAHGVEARLAPVAAQIMRAAGRSTHTHARATLPGLALELHRLAHLAGDVAALHDLSLELNALREQLSAIPEDERKQSTVSEAQLARADAIVAKPAPTDAAGLGALHAEVLDLGARLDLLDGLPPSLRRLNRALDRILTASDRARRGLGRSADLAMGFRSLLAKIRAAAGE